MKTATLLIVFCMLVACIAQAQMQSKAAAANPYNLPDGLYSEITTPRGVIVCELYYKKTPMTVANYVGLAEGTLGPEPRVPYYNGSTYFRITRGYVLQGGSPAPDRPRSAARLGYQFPDEFVPGLRHDSLGVMQMANGGPGTNGSQNCLMLGPAQRLNYLHTVFGHTVRGDDVLPKIELNDPMQVKILRIGKVAQDFKTDEASFKALVAKAKVVAGPFEPGPQTHFYDPDALLPTQPTRAVHFNMKLMNFERFTGQRVMARVFAKTPAEVGGKWDERLASLAEKLGVAKAGALVVYTADDDKWHVRIGAESAATFIAGPRKADGTKAPVAPGKTLDQAIQEYLAAAKEWGTDLIAKSKDAVPPNDSAGPKQELKLRADAMLDELIFRLETAAPAS